MRIALAQRKILGRNGASRIILEQMKRFTDAGHEVFLYCARLGVDVPDRVRVHKYFSLNPSKKARRDGYAVGFEKFCRKNGIDVAVGNGDTIYQDVLFMHNILELENKIINGDDRHKESAIFQVHDRTLSDCAFRILVCNSHLMRDYFIKRYSIPPEKVFVDYPGYEPATFNPSGRENAEAVIRGKHGIQRKNIIGFISSGNLKKRGIDVLTEALTGLDPAVSADTALLLVGKDEMAEEYKKRIESVNGGLQVVCAGAVGDVENYYKACSLLIHPAHIEEFGMTILEAMACGTVPVTSKMSGASEIFPQSMSGFVSDIPDADGLRASVERLLTDDGLRGSLSADCAETATEYSWEKYFRKLTAIYESCGIIVL